jgi:hypothetical protein
MTSEPIGYEAALERFAHGKRLARLARFVHARSDDRCDACGSTLPRRLFGLKDAQTGRCYFVGENCLRGLLEAGLVARARYRQHAEVAYELEKELRCEGESPPLGHSVVETPARSSAEAAPPIPGYPTVHVEDPVREGRWVRQNGAVVLEERRTHADILIVVAISGLFGQTVGGRGYDR